MRAIAVFPDTREVKMIEHEEPRININSINEKTAYGAERSLKMDFTEYDRIDDWIHDGEHNGINYRFHDGRPGE